MSQNIIVAVACILTLGASIFAWWMENGKSHNHTQHIESEETEHEKN